MRKKVIVLNGLKITNFERVFQQFFGCSFTAELAKTVIEMVSTEVTKTGSKIGIVQIWHYFSCWVNLQKMTKLKWREEFIFPFVEEISKNPKKPNVWKLLQKPFKKTSKKVVKGFPNDTATLLPLLKQYVKFANGCYGELALQFLNGNHFPIKQFSSELHFYASYTEVPIEDIIYMSITETKSDLFNSDYEPRFILSVDHSQSTVVLAFRGTMSARGYRQLLTFRCRS